jgi:hypothetical protein
MVFFSRDGPCQYDPVLAGHGLAHFHKMASFTASASSSGHPWSEFAGAGPGHGENELWVHKEGCLSAAEVTGAPLLWLQRGAYARLAAEEPQTM